MDPCALLRSPAAGLVLRPAFDRLAVPAIARVYLPLSRAWAAGLAAEGDAVRLAALLPCLGGRPNGAVRKALRGLASRAQAYADAARLWEAALFDRAASDPAALRGIEAARAATAQGLMAGRLLFLPAHLRARFPAVAWAVAAPGEVARRHGHRLRSAAARFPAPEVPPALELSRAIEGDGYATQWLRAPTRVGEAADTLWARIERPAGPGPHPVLIFTHGICMETEFFREAGSPSSRLAAAGLVAIRPEGPYHGRRRVPGFYGGEQVMALGPLGLLDYFEAHVRELGQLTAWARDTFGGPVAVGGVSLGALTAQLALSAARHWPAAMRPDAGFLVTTSDSLMRVALTGSLPLALGAPWVIAENGWNRRTLARWTPLLDPGEAPAPDPGNIVVVLGRRDTVTAYDEGRRLMARWGVPPANVFTRDLGHFTASLHLYRDAGPFQRLREILARA